MTAELEGHYRRLLAWFPADHRREYAEEMLGVLMAGAGEQQRRPTRREAANLLVSATWLRLKVGRTGETRSHGPWADAVAVLALLAPILLVGKYLRPVFDAIGWRLRTGWIQPALSQSLTWWRIAVWAVVALAIGYGARHGWRRLATVMAWIAVLVEVIALARRDDLYPGAHVAAGWPLLVALLAATLVTLSHGRGAGLLGRSGVLWFAASAATAAMTALASPLFTHVVSLLEQQLSDVATDGADTGGPFESWPFLDQYGYALVAAVGWGLCVLFALLGVSRTPAHVRRRTFTILAPTMTLLGLLQLGFDQPLSGAVTIPRVLDGPLQLALLVTAPVLVLAVALHIGQRRERTAVEETD